jgi:hypothetical protein
MSTHKAVHLHDYRASGIKVNAQRMRHLSRYFWLIVPLVPKDRHCPRSSSPLLGLDTTVELTERCGHLLESQR